jgi:hypothetical protein
MQKEMKIEELVKFKRVFIGRDRGKRNLFLGVWAEKRMREPGAIYLRVPTPWDIAAIVKEHYADKAKRAWK